MPDEGQQDQQQPTTGTSFWYWDTGLPVIVECTRTDYGDLTIDDPQFIYLVAERVDQLVRQGAQEGVGMPGDVEAGLLPTVGDFAGVIRAGKATLIGLTVAGKLCLPRQ